MIATRRIKAARPKTKLFPKNLNSMYSETAKLKGTLKMLGKAEYKKFNESASD